MRSLSCVPRHALTALQPHNSISVQALRGIGSHSRNCNEAMAHAHGPKHTSDARRGAPRCTDDIVGMFLTAEVTVSPLGRCTQARVGPRLDPTV